MKYPKDKPSILRKLSILSVCFLISTLLITEVSCNKANNSDKSQIDFSQIDSWAFYSIDNTHEIDVFFVAPTIYGGTDSSYSMSINDPVERLNFIGALNMEKGIYHEGDVNFYAPFYRKASLNCYVIWAYDDVVLII